MTRVRQKWIALVAALVLAIGCACVAVGVSSAVPAKAYADKVTVATTMTTMPLKGKSLSKSDVSYMGSKVYSKWYTFTTSKRNSSYRISLSDLVQQDLDVTLYDADYNIIDTWNTGDRLRGTYTSLDRSAKFYVKLGRDTMGTSRADYKITIKEIVTPPDPVTNVKVTSKKGSKKITVSYTKSTYATGYLIRGQRNFGKNRAYFYKYTKSGKISFKTDYKGKKRPYKIRVRPYRTVNGKKYFGSWSKTYTIIVR